MALPKAPATYGDFVERFPALASAWEQCRAAASSGPLEARTAALVKLAVAIGMLREGAVHSAARKAKAVGVTREEVDQVIAVAASTIGFPSTVAVFSWIRESWEPTRSQPKRARGRDGG